MIQSRSGLPINPEIPDRARYSGNRKLCLTLVGAESRSKKIIACFVRTGVFAPLPSARLIRAAFAAG